MSSKPKLIVIVGPTVSGKSELAVKLAKKFSGEIISADSRQVYRGLDIGTAKVPGCWRKTRKTNVHLITRSCDKMNIFIYKKIPHYCIDFVSPKRTYTVAEYKKCAQDAIHDIAGREKIPIIVGGTGFWIDAVVYDLNFPAVSPNRELRKKLEKKTPAALLKLLKKLDPVRAQTIEQKNPRRLIRAIEIAKALGKIPKIKKRSPYRALWIWIQLPRETLEHRIHRRLLQRMRDGMVDEAKELRRRGLAWKRFYELGLEYRFLADYLRGKISKKLLCEGLEKEIRRYARRQMLWWKNNPEIHWIKTPQEAESVIKIIGMVEPHPLSAN